MNDEELLRYSRHILLEQIGIEGQESWLRSKVLIIGCGGLASSAISILAASGIGHLLLVDDDVVDLSNLQRQIIFRQSDLNCNKAKACAQQVALLNPHIKVSIIEKRVGAQDLFDLMQDIDIVLDCSDNFKTRHAINQAAYLNQKILVSGAAVGFSGQLSVYDFRNKNNVCYACFNEKQEGQDGACAVFGVFSPLVNIIGSLQAAEALKLLAGLSSELVNKLQCFDALSSQWQTFVIAKNVDCLICGINKDEQN